MIKKTLLLMISMIFILGCDCKGSSKTLSDEENIIVERKRLAGVSITTPDIYVIRVDNCQYVVVVSGGKGVSIIHKADCQNPEHYKQK